MEVVAVESPRFKHQRVEAEIRRMVQSLPVGARLPAERSLATQFGCNFLTVRRALKELVDDGSIVRRIGSGTFVARSARVNTRSGGAVRVGVLVWQGGDAYSYRVLQGLGQEAAAQKIELRSAWVRDFAEDGQARAKELAEDGCAALTLPWFPHDRVDEVAVFARACGVPVSLPMLVPGLESHCFERQELFSQSLLSLTEQLCGYFYALGRRKIAMLGPDQPSDMVLHRMVSAYACHTSRLNLPNFCGLVRPGASAMDALAKRWKEHAGDLAVISYDDEHALRFVTAMHKLGLRAPDDFLIVGHNNTEASAFSDPPLSTVCQNFNYIGHWLLRSARALAKGEVEQSDAPPRLQLLVRGTCGGAGRIDEALLAKVSGLDIVSDADGAASRGELSGVA